jgi:GT2 family glycosyltransferase
MPQLSWQEQGRRAMTRLPDVPVIILNWNGWEDTFACLRSLRATDEVHTVWLVDNASDIDRSREAMTIYSGLRVLRWEDNHGWAGGYNRALLLAAREGHELAYLLNNDCTVTPDFLFSVLAVASSDDRIAAVGSYVAFGGSSESLMFDGEYHAPGSVQVHAEKRVQPVRQVSGAAMLVRVQAMEECGYFDERFFCYWEETEWCARVAEAGWRLFACGGSLVFHRDQGSDVGANATYYLIRNRFLIAEQDCFHLSLTSALAMIYRHLRVANEARRTGNLETARAIVAGLWDGVMQRWGRRAAPPPRVATYLLTYCWPFPAGSFRAVVNRARTPGTLPTRYRTRGG